MLGNRTVIQAFWAFFRDLAAGDPVAIAILCGMLAFLVVLGLLGGWILWSRKRDQERHRQKLYGKYKKRESSGTMKQNRDL